MKLNWNFLRGEGGSKTRNLPWGEYGYFLELVISCIYSAFRKCMAFGEFPKRTQCFGSPRRWSFWPSINMQILQTFLLYFHGTSWENLYFIFGDHFSHSHISLFDQVVIL